MENSFHGSIAEIQDVSVDNFSAVNSRAFFLSHGHTDHFNGIDDKTLHKNFKNSDGVFIYMTQLTCEILKNMTKCFSDFKKYIKIIKLGTETIKLPARDKCPEEYLTVTTIPAGHCPGSVMFLFQTSKDHNVLYTGDFRISSSDVSKFCQLHDKHKKPIALDALYIDTTFLHHDYEHFPKRSDSIKEMCSEIKKWLNLDKNNRILLSLSAKFGYEYVFVEINQQINEKVLVNYARMKVYKNIPDILNSVTENNDDSRIHLPESRSGGYNYLTIRLSALCWKGYQPGTSTVRKLDVGTLQVCFPTHCSRSELLNFVSYFAPKRIVGFPNKIKPSLLNVYKDNFEEIMVDRKEEKKRSYKRKLRSNDDVLKKMFRL